MTVVPLPSQKRVLLAAAWEADVLAGWRLQEPPGMLDWGVSESYLDPDKTAVHDCSTPPS